MRLCAIVLCLSNNSPFVNKSSTFLQVQVLFDSVDVPTIQSFALPAQATLLSWSPELVKFIATLFHISFLKRWFVTDTLFRSARLLTQVYLVDCRVSHGCVSHSRFSQCQVQTWQLLPLGARPLNQQKHIPQQCTLFRFYWSVLNLTLRKFNCCLLYVYCVLVLVRATLSWLVFLARCLAWLFFTWLFSHGALSTSSSSAINEQL